MCRDRSLISHFLDGDFFIQDTGGHIYLSSKFVFTPTLRNYRAVFTEVSILKNTLNSAITTGGSVLVSIILDCQRHGIARYGLSKLAGHSYCKNVPVYASYTLVPDVPKVASTGHYQALIAAHL